MRVDKYYDKEYPDLNELSIHNKARNYLILNNYDISKFDDFKIDQIGYGIKNGHNVDYYINDNYSIEIMLFIYRVLYTNYYYINGSGVGIKISENQKIRKIKLLKKYIKNNYDHNLCAKIYKIISESKNIEQEINLAIMEN